MPVDTSIYQNLLRPPKSAAEYSTELDQADLARGQLAAQKVNLIGAQQDLADQQKVREVYSRPGFDPLSAGSLKDIYAASPKAGMAAQKAQLDARETQAKIGGQEATTQATQFETARKKITTAMQIVTSANDPATAHAGFRQAVQQGLMTPEEAAQKEQEVPNDPAGFQKWRESSALALLTAKDRFDLQAKQVAAAETNRHNTASEGLTKRGQDVSAATSRQNTAANIVKDYTIAGLDANGKDTGGESGLSPAAIENAAARYNLDGTMPTNIGRGQQGSRDLRKIQNRAAELAMGTDPTQIRVNQLDAKSAGSALTQLTKAKTMSAAFEDTANQNADLALSLSKKNDRTGIPMLNAGLQAWRTGTGSPEATQFAAANETFVNEYAKIMSGGMGNGPVSDSARNKAHTLLTTGMTDGQYEGNVRLLQREMKNRMAGFDNQEKALKARMGGKSAAAPDSAAGGSGGAELPPDIAAIVNRHKDK